jgi:hypothetical protein
MLETVIFKRAKNKEPKMRQYLLSIMAAGALLLPEAALAEMSAEEIAKATQNPLTAMYSVPIQNNTYFDIGPSSETKNIANFQPVIPIDFSEDWTLVTRTIMPITYLPEGLAKNPTLGISDDSQFGLGDTTFTAFFTPKNTEKGDWIWGVGPVFYLPTASNDSLGTQKWGAGAAAVALNMSGKWVYGTLIMNIWSLAGSGQDEGIQKINLMQLQPFVNYNLDDGWFVTSVPIITADWEADSDHRWTVPLGGGFGKAMQIGKTPMTAQLHAYYNIVTPDDYGETWQMRIQLQFLFPRK